MAEPTLKAGSATEIKRLEALLNSIASGKALPLTGLVGTGFDFKPKSKKLGLFQGNRPISEEEYIDLVINGFLNGIIPQELDIYLIELESLSKKDPVRFAAWKNSGFLPTTFAGGVNSRLRSELASRGLLPDVKGVGESLFKKSFNSLEKAGRLYYYKDSFFVTDANATEIFQEVLSSPDIPVGPYNAGGAEAGVVVVEPDNTSVLIVGMARYDTSTNNMVFIRGAKQDYAPFPKPRWYSDTTDTQTPQLDTNKSLAALTDVGHAVGETHSQGMQIALANLQVLLEYEKQKANRAPVLDYLLNVEKELHRVVDNLKALDKIYFKTVKQVSEDIIGSAAFKQLMEMAHIAGQDEIVIAEEISPGQFTGRIIKSSLNYDITASSSEISSGNAFKGAKGTAFFNQGLNVLKGLALERAKLVIYEEGSSSLFTQLVLRNLDLVFNTKDFSTAIIKQKKRKNLTKIKLRGPSSKFNVSSLVAKQKKLEEQIRRNKKSLATEVKKSKPIVINRIGQIYKDERGKNYTAIIAGINKYIQQAVIARMNYPALENRSGRFARSVQVTGVDAQAIRYIYQKSPYQVFSMSTGKYPWKSIHRDPDKLIKAAIEDVIRGKFSAYFRELPRISEGA